MVSQTKLASLKKKTRPLLLFEEKDVVAPCESEQKTKRGGIVHCLDEWVEMLCCHQT